MKIAAPHRMGTALTYASSATVVHGRDGFPLFPSSLEAIVSTKSAGERWPWEGGGVEFIDENGGGPGVRLRTPVKEKRGK